MSIIIAPFSWVLRNLYLLVGNYGIALILFTVVVKLILLPFGMKSKKSMMKTSRLAPRLKELEKKYKDDQMKYQTEVSKMYKAEGVNPMTGCLWSFIPLPILFGLYGVIRSPLTNLMKLTEDQITLVSDTLSKLGVDVTGLSGTYGQITIASHIHDNIDAVRAVVPNIIDIDYSFLGLDLAQIPQWKFWFEDGFFSQTPAIVWATIGLFLIPIISGAMNFVSSWLMQKMNNSVATNEKGEKDSSLASAASSSMKSMLYFMPLMSIWIGFVMPAGICVYWIASSFFSMIQDIILTKHYRKVYDAEDAVKAQRAAEEEALEAERQRKREEQKKLLPEGAVNPNTSRRKVKNQQKALEVKAPEGKLSPEEREAFKAELVDKPNPTDKNRPYARGRAYVADRFSGSGAADEDAEQQSLPESAEPAADESDAGSAPESIGAIELNNTIEAANTVEDINSIEPAGKPEDGSTDSGDFVDF